MWIYKPGLQNVDSSIFEVIGKSLFIAQKYEMTCKEIISMFLAIETVLVPNKNASLEEFISYSERLRNMFMGQLISIANDKIRDQLTKENLAILEKGTKSRNWIAHQCCRQLVDDNLVRNKSNIDRSEFALHLKDLLSADFLVSKWLFEFHEKEPANFINNKNYVESLLEWTMS